MIGDVHFNTSHVSINRFWTCIKFYIHTWILPLQMLKNLKKSIPENCLRMPPPELKFISC